MPSAGVQPNLHAMTLGLVTGVNFTVNIKPK
jgi:hypothetical protein